MSAEHSPSSQDTRSSTHKLVEDDVERGTSTTNKPRKFDPEYLRQLSDNRQSKSNAISLVTGTGYGVYKSAIIPTIRAAEQDIILVTCFWASSVTRKDIHDALLHLSKKAMASRTNINVHICFSSSSMARNLLVATPEQGEYYPPNKWKKLGLPQIDKVPGLTIRVTRKFFRPFGIIHSKYVIVDRKVAVFPSCNVSWERWFEIAITVRGPIVDHLLSFHTEFWDNGSPLKTHNSTTNVESSTAQDLTAADDPSVPQPILLDNREVNITLLPSMNAPGTIPTHLQPRSILAYCPGFAKVPRTFPQTPLLVATHYLIETARKKIVLLTPNLTEQSVLNALTDALNRGVDVHIWTNKSLMTAEQLVTAGGTTPMYIKTLTKRWDEMRGRQKRGGLKTVYFDGSAGPQSIQEQDKEMQPVKLHAKVTIVDQRVMLLGSGNMDAASWQTSQELGLLIEDKEIVKKFLHKWRYGKLGD